MFLPPSLLPHPLGHVPGCPRRAGSRQAIITWASEAPLHRGGLVVAACMAVLRRCWRTSRRPLRLVHAPFTPSSPVFVPLVFRSLHAADDAIEVGLVQCVGRVAVLAAGDDVLLQLTQRTTLVDGRQTTAQRGLQLYDGVFVHVLRVAIGVDAHVLLIAPFCGLAAAKILLPRNDAPIQPIGKLFVEVEMVQQHVILVLKHHVRVLICHPDTR
mmetsp:Transcript_8401/g.20547  ORF Transcript_8401/g.20547 Transcript_8401/m.20547 type:complete len:213 (+) Transcript_8401:706-1344(+)